jgi:Fe-S cluster assembly ATP-binding protein
LYNDFQNEAMSLVLNNLTVKMGEKLIFGNINLRVNPGEIHLIVGKNGFGKTSILKTIMGSPQFNVVKGKILLDSKDILRKKTDERVKLGITMSFQNPPAIEGVTVGDVYKILNFKKNNTEYVSQILPKIANISMDKLSGGEIKKADLYLTSGINYKYILLDEPELSLDVPSLKILIGFIASLKEADKGIVLVTHNEYFIKLVKPDFIHRLTSQGLLDSK